ncbi:hypothetical protein GCK72_010117 [Caenorhabditis remanei]|uniref:Aminopeptidase N-like N-terminal domain-containing protein n=1 Tax=Caenorhabditis remanei TaxID=31234 RepID=A0A6A5H2D9_CAERE|nr:hypothetical protein GCK72_010117 [Caenorhabditis remanei]KAF1761858.1 hypothetical protein GCK72_010117 [Caenorhabditis remanei]
MVPPPASPSKKDKSSCLCFALIAIIIGIILCAGLMTWIFVLRENGDGPDVDWQNATEIPTTTTSKASSTTTELESTTTTSAEFKNDATSSTTTTQSATPETTTVSTTTTTEEVTTTTASEIVMPVDVASILKDKTKEFEIVEKCAQIQVLHVSCTPSSSQLTSDPSKFQPIHYTLNITIRDIRKPVLEGHMQLFASTKDQIQAISLHSVKIHNLENRDRVHVINCNTGETICVSRVHQVDEVIHLELAQSISSGVDLRIDIDGFISADSGPNVYKQIPTAKWRVPQMVGSIFEPTSARHVFPSFDLHNQKATFNLCLNHGPSMTAISNSLINPNISTSGISCFEKTVPLTAQQISFVAFERTNPLFYNTTTLDGAYLPEINMIFNLNAKNFQQYEWIHSEVSKVMSLMSKWSGFSYPLPRLEIVVAPVMAGHSALGVITLPAQAIAYQKHTSTHETLIKEVIGQWMEGVVTTEHTCFEKALIAYLEWKINEELQIVKKTRKMEVSRIRPRNLNETADQLRVIRQIKPQSTSLCSPRFVEVFYTLDETYGQDTVVGMIRVIFDQFAFSTATISDWASAAETSTGGRPEAGALIHEWYRPSSKISRPVLRAVVSSNSVDFHQLTEDNWTVPLEISGSAGTQLVVISEKKQTVPFVSTDYVVVDASRKSHAFVVYDADTYLRLIRCFGDSRCPSKEIGGVFADLGAALLANILPKPDNQDVAKWKSVFKFMAQQNLVEGTAACCVEHAIREMRKCSYWDIQDVCTKIDFNIVLAAVA